MLADWRAGKGELTDLEQEAFGWTHKVVAGWLFDEWGFPATLRVAVTETGRPEDSAVQYPVVRVMSSLSAPRDDSEVIEETASRVTTVFGCLRIMRSAFWRRLATTGRPWPSL